MQAENNLLKKRINLFDGTALVAGSMLGSGIFIVSADIARNVGSPGWLMLVWLITGVLTIIAALSYGELAAMMPKVGGQYVYLRESYNPLVGFLYGWTLFFVIQTGTIAAVGVGFAKFSGVLMPWISEKNILLDLGFMKINSTQFVGIAMILFLTWLNTNGIVIGKTVQNIFTSTKVLVILFLIIAGLIIANNNGAFDVNREIFWNAQQTGNGGEIIPLSGFALIVAIATAMVGSIFSSDAWNNLTFTSGEVINPKRNIPLSLFFGTLIITVIYLLANFVYIKILPLRGLPDGTTIFEKGIQFAVNDRVGTAAMNAIIGDYAAIIMAVFIMLSTFGCNNGLILQGARVYYAMANDNLFFKKAGKLNKKGVPFFALLFQGIWAGILCLTGTYSDLLDYVVFAVLLFYILTILSVFILRVKKPELERPYKAFGYPVIPALYILTTSVIMIILLFYKPNYTFPGLIIVLLGIPLYYIWRKYEKK
ncbi:MAG: amino acid permease [Bacteroidales bacterium]|nr:amino acid permease [Bacteroidales bacterium]